MGDRMIAATASILKAVCFSDDPHFKQIKEIETNWIYKSNFNRQPLTLPCYATTRFSIAIMAGMRDRLIQWYFGEILLMLDFAENC